MKMPRFIVYATQTVEYCMKVEADTLEQANKIANEARFYDWEECDYADWEVAEDYTVELKENENA
jgi:hypothetical protein